MGRPSSYSYCKRLALADDHHLEVIRSLEWDLVGVIIASRLALSDSIDVPFDDGFCNVLYMA